ncbi:MAG: ZmpA/ZmpB/ZmpC family metallo-endopeptidase, partial [Gemella sp.]|nr:ZmpA/ZmpB/ZmpC family metallo-endopeptidase [Gemella sp.]
KEIHNLYETIKDEKTKLISSSEKAVITSENKVIAVGVKPSVREEITAKAGVIYEEDKSMAVDSAPVTKQAGQDEKTRFVRTYLLDKKTGNVTANPETSEKTQTKQDMIVVVGTMPTTRIETRKYSIEYKSSDKLEVGQEQIEIPGKDGSVVYTTTYTLDKSTGKAVANPETEEVKEAVVNQVILVGTKPRVVTRTINYKMEDGSKAPESKVQTVEFIKDIVSTDSTTGLRTYSDWKTANNEFASVDSPTVAKYTADKKLVEKESVTADSTDKTVDVLYKVNIIETEDKKVVKRTINYLYEEDKSPVFDPFVQEVTYTRTKFTNEVTGEVKYGDWNIASQNLDEKISPEKDGYVVDIEKVDLLATSPDSKDEEVTVLYTDKFIEVKDVDTASLYFSLSGGEYTRVMALDTVPTDYSKYYVKVKSDQFKDLQLSVKSITEDTVNGQAVYKVVTTHPKLKQDENYNGYEEDYTIYVAKADASLQGVRTFRELLDRVKANPAENIVLANDISAEGFDVSLKDTAYITENFTGKLSGKNGDKNFAIYDLKLPLFSTLNKATIEDLALKNVDIDSNHYEVVAPLAKKAENGSVLRNVVVQGNIAASNNYGNYDSGDSGPARLVVGGIVGELAASTMTDSVFSGNINGDSTGIRYWDSTSRGRNTDLVLGGLAGIVSGASQVLNNKVSSNIHINAVDGVGATNDPGRWVSDPMGNPLYAGTLVGLASAGTYANNYAEGNLVNQLDNQYTRYTDSKDRSHHTGIVGGLFGSVGRTTMRENTTAVAVTNGAVVSTSAVNGQNVVTGLASGDKTNPGTTSSVTLADVATSKDAIKKALEQSNQYISNEFDVDYAQVKGYQASHAQAYANMEKLLPFYNRAFIVKEANKLAASDNLVTKKLLSVTPMKDAVVVSDVSGDKDAINKLLLHFADSSVEYRDVAYKEEFKNTKIAEYKLTESGVAYTTDQFVNSYEAIVAVVKDDLSTVSYTGDEVWAALDTNVTKNETKIRELYLEERFEEVQANLEKVLKNVLGTSTAYANSNDVIDYIKKNKAELLLGLSYVSRWYNIDFNETNVQNLVTYQPDFFGKQVSTLEWLVEVGSAGYRALNPRVNDEKAASLVGENNNSENLHEILDSYRKVFASDKTMEEWYNSSVKAYVATGKAIDKDRNEIGNSDLYHQLNTRLASVIYLSGTSVDYSNAILPLLTARKDKIYIISTGASMQFGSLDAYVNRELKDTNQAEYNSELEKIKRAIDKVAHNQAKHWEAWHAVANENVEGRLVSNKPVWDTLFMKTATGKTWSDKFGENASEAIKDFFGPLGKHSATQPRSGQEGFSNGTEVYFTHANALTADGESIWTHEQVHNWDGGVYLGGNGRRSGAGMEAYAEGLLQAPRGRTRDALGINMYFDNTLENNPYPEYNSSPERFQNATDLQNFVKGMMDVLYVMDYAEAKSIMNLTPEQQIAKLTKLTSIPRGTSVHKDDKFVSITADDLKNGLTTINDFIDSGLALSRYYGNNTVGETGGTNFYRSYVKVNMFTPFFGLEQNDTGVSGAYTFRRAAFEVLAEYGYQAFMDYASGKYKTDLEAVTAIFNGSHGNNLTDFKKDMFKQRIDRLTSLKPVTFNVGSKTYTINNSDDLMNTMNELVQAGNNNNIVNFKRAMYVAYMKDTNEFRTSIFNV